MFFQDPLIGMKAEFPNIEFKCPCKVNITIVPKQILHFQKFSFFLQQISLDNSTCSAANTKLSWTAGTYKS